jgi:predicted nucleic acid-binding protein
MRLGRPGWNVVVALNRFAIVDLHTNIVRHAGTFPEPRLRALDAIHLATAYVTMTKRFVTNDARQAAVAQNLGMDVLSPGTEL